VADEPAAVGDGDWVGPGPDESFSLKVRRPTAATATAVHTTAADSQGCACLVCAGVEVRCSHRLIKSVVLDRQATDSARATTPTRYCCQPSSRGSHAKQNIDAAIAAVTTPTVVRKTGGSESTSSRKALDIFDFRIVSITAHATPSAPLTNVCSDAIVSLVLGSRFSIFMRFLVSSASRAETEGLTVGTKREGEC
jgi:hypothetical protein